VGDTLLSLHADGVLRLWDHRAAVAGAPDADVLTSLVRLGGSSPSSPPVVPTALLHPDTYVNKVAVGTASGSVLIVNVRTGAVVHECRLPGAGGVAVTCLAQSPVVDVVAAGLADGRVIVHNLRADATVCTFAHALGASSSSTTSSSSAPAAAPGGSPRVTALSFSLGGVLPTPTLCSATEGGSLAFWDLDAKVLRHVLPSAHAAPVLFVGFLPGQPCVVTAGADNALRVWVVDRLDGTPKLLKSRAGHTAPPRILRYYGGSSVTEIASGAGADARVCEIASAGADRTLRLFHTALDRQNTELSQGPLLARAKELGVHPSALRLPQVTAMAVSDRRNAQWADVVTAHAGEGRASCWSWDRRRLEDRTLVLPNPRETVTAVAISACGHFAFLGGAGGSVVQFNLQSGGRKGTYPKDPRVHTSFAAKGKKRGLAYPGGADLGPVDRDTGRGFDDGLREAVPTADSVDATLALAMGIMPAARLPASALLTDGAAAPASSGSSSGGSGGRQGTGLASATAAPLTAPARHSSAVCGVASDLLNSTLVSVDSSGLVLFWDFETHEARSSLRLPSTASSLVLSRESGLAAVACDDFTVRVLDISTRRQVRTFSGHTNRITDMCFSPDGRWLVTASLDRSVRVWDLPMSRCLDWLAFSRVPVSVTFSPTAEYLVTAHADSVALYMWANKAHFGTVVLEGAPSAPVHMDLPDIAAGGGEGGGDGDDEADGMGTGVTGDGDVPEDFPQTAGAAAAASAGAKRARVETKAASAEGAEPGAASASAPSSITPKAGMSITLSGKPQSTWANLDKLELIYKRNKPAEAPKKPEQAPFFLPTAGGLKPTFVAPGAGAGAGTNVVVEPEGEDEEDDEEDEGAWAGPAGDTTGTGAAPSKQAVTEVRGRFITSHGMRTARSVLAQLLRQADDAGRDGDDEMGAGRRSSGAAAVAAHLASLSPAQIDLEVRSLCLGPEDPDGVALLAALLRYLRWAVGGGGEGGEGEASPSFDLAQAHLALVLAVYGDLVASIGPLREEAGRVRVAQKAGSTRLRSLIDGALCLTRTFLE
jgi:U3 small nucleolar RNA-associated protein 21